MKRSITMKTLCIVVSIICAAAAIPSRCARAQSLYLRDPKETEAFLVAKKAYEDGFYDVSLGLFQKFLQAYPDSQRASQAQLFKGQCLFQISRYTDALSAFEGLLNQPAADAVKDGVLFWMAEVYFKSKNYDRAATFYQRVVNEFPSSQYLPAAYYSLGWCFFEQRSFDKALTYFKAVESKFPQDPAAADAQQKILECYYNMKNYGVLKEAAQSYAVRYAGDTRRLPYFQFYLAETYYYLDDYAQASVWYEKVAQGARDPKLQAVGKLGIGWSRVQQKRYTEAQAVFDGIRSGDLEPASRDILLLGEAIILVQTGRPDEAVEKYDRLIRESNDPSVTARANMAKADFLCGQSKYAQAIPLYRRALELSENGKLPGDTVDNAHYGLAWAYLKTGEFKDAVQEFQKIVKGTGDPVFKASALMQIGDAYLDSGDFRRAQETYDSVLRLYPDSVYGDYVGYQLGIIALKQKKFEAAIAAFEGLARRFPDSKLRDDAAYAVGLAYFQKQDYKSSAEIFTAFRRDFKESALMLQALNMLGSSLYNLGKFKESIEAYKDVVRNYGNDNESLLKAEYEIADCYYRMGNEKEALERFNSLRSKYPDASLTPEVIWWIGEYYYRHKKPELARRYFSQLIEDFPDAKLTSDAYYALGWSYEDEAMHDEAVENFRKVLVSGNADLAGKAAVAIADIYVKDGAPEKALELYRERLGRYPDLGPVLYPKLGDVFYKMSRYDDALQSYRAALKLLPPKDAAAVQFKLAESCQALDKIDDAVIEYMKLPYLYSDNASLAVKALLRVAQINEDRRNIPAALEMYQKIIDMGVDESAFARESIERIKERSEKSKMKKTR